MNKIIEMLNIKDEYYRKEIEENPRRATTYWRPNYAEVRNDISFIKDNMEPVEDCEDAVYLKMSIDDLLKRHFYDFMASYDYGDLCRGTTVKNCAGQFKPCVLSVYHNPEEEITKVEMYDRETKQRTDDIYAIIKIRYNENINQKLEIVERKFVVNEEMIDNEDINIVMRGTPAGTLLGQSVFYDDNKITISELSLERRATKNGLINKSINRRVVFNIETGLTYKLADFDTTIRKRINTKRDPFRCITAWSLRYPGFDALNISNDELYAIGHAIEEYIDDPNAIPFDEYVKGHLSKSDAYLKSGAPRLSLLVAYNTNPFVSYNNLMAVYNVKSACIEHKIEIKPEAVNSMKKRKTRITTYKDYKRIKTVAHSFKKYFNPKMLRNKDIAQELAKYLMFHGYSKKYINAVINRPYYPRSLYYEYETYRQMLNSTNLVVDVNNKQKIAQAYITGGISDFSIRYIFDCALYEDLSKKHKETDLVNAILKDDNFSLFYDACTLYTMIKRNIPNYTVEVKRLRIKQIHDVISKDHRLIRDRTYRFIYPEEFRKYNTFIDGYAFKLATESDELREIGSSMSICVGGYSHKVANLETLIVSMSADDEYVGCIEITANENAVVQAKAKYNEHLDGDKAEALSKYMEQLDLSTGPFCRDIPEQYTRKSKVKEINMDDVKVMETKGVIVDGEIVKKEVEYVPQRRTVRGQQANQPIILPHAEF